MAAFLRLGRVQRAMFRKHLPGDHLVVDLSLGHGAIALVELNGIHRVLVGRGAVPVLVRDGAFAGLALACDDGGIGREDERRKRLFGLLHLGG